MKEFSCKDVGKDCDYTVSGNTDQEVLDGALKHGKEAHGMKDSDFTDDLKNKIKGLIKDKKAAA